MAKKILLLTITLATIAGGTGCSLRSVATSVPPRVFREAHGYSAYSSSSSFLSCEMKGIGSWLPSCNLSSSYWSSQAMASLESRCSLEDSIPSSSNWFRCGELTGWLQKCRCGTRPRKPSGLFAEATPRTLDDRSRAYQWSANFDP